MSKGNQTNPRFTSCLDEIRYSCENDVNSNPELFLATSMQFLHRLLAERSTSRYVSRDVNGIPMSRLQAEDLKEQENDTPRQLYFQQIDDQIDEYKGQLRNMENFLSAIQLDAEKPIRNSMDCDAIVSNRTKNVRRNPDPSNFRSAKLSDDSYNSVIQKPSLCNSAYLHSISNYELPNNKISDRPKIKETTPEVEGDFTVRLQTRTAVPVRTRIKKNGAQSSASYADIVRNAVSGLARNCGRKHKSKRTKHAGSSCCLRAENMNDPREAGRRRGYQSEVDSEISSESQVYDERDSDITKEIPLRVHVAMETDSNPKKPVTLLVRVPNAVFDLLNRKISDGDTKILSSDPSAEVCPHPGKKKKRITSVFRNFLKGRRTPSSTTICSEKEKVSSSVIMTVEETSNDMENQVGDTYGELMYELQKSTSCDTFNRERIREFLRESNNNLSAEALNTGHLSVKCMASRPMKSVNGYEKIPLNSSPSLISYGKKPWNGIAAGCARRKLLNDKTQRTQVESSNKTGIMKDLTNDLVEKIIPLRCSEGSPQLGNTRGEMCQRDVAMFLKLATEIRKTQVHRVANDKHVEIPVRIKTAKAPLLLHKTKNMPEGFSYHDAFDPEMKNTQAPQNRMENQQFLEMLSGTLPEGNYSKQNKYGDPRELPSSSDSLENGLQDYFQLPRNREDSALEVLLRHIVANTSITSSAKPYQAERDTTMQTVPKRQLSKISVCYSSESLSGSDHEIPEAERNNSTVIQDDYIINNGVLSNEPEKLGNRQYFHHYEITEQKYTCYRPDDGIAIHHDESEHDFPAVGYRFSQSSDEITKNENTNLFLTEDRRNLVPCDRTEVIIEEQNCDIIGPQVKTQNMIDSEKKSLSIRETEKTIFYHPILSKQICGDRKEFADAMIRWWGPQINYSTTPSRRTQLSDYSVSINNPM